MAIKKSKIIVFEILLLFMILIYIICNIYDNNKVILENEKSNSIIKSNAITMMYETDVGSGEYQVSNDSTWPESGYAFNETLSKCENGGKIIWNDDTKKITMQTTTSDKCYVYFDIKIISFKLRETIYYAEEGMTWEEWVNSKYNINGFSTGGSSDSLIYLLEVGYVTFYGSEVSKNDTIKPKGIYFIYNTVPLPPDITLASDFSNSYDLTTSDFSSLASIEYLQVFFEESFGVTEAFDLIENYIYEEITFGNLIENFSDLVIEIYNPPDSYDNIKMIKQFFHISLNENSYNQVTDYGTFVIGIEHSFNVLENNIMIMYFSNTRRAIDFIEPSTIYENTIIFESLEGEGLYAILLLE